MKIAYAILSAFLLGICGCATTISGTLQPVKPDKNFSYEDARINISRLDGESATRENYVLSVDEQGRFKTTKDLPEGRYLVEALVPGFAAESKTVELSSSQELQLTVKPLRAANVDSISPNMDVDVGKGSGDATLMPPSL